VKKSRERRTGFDPALRLDWCDRLGPSERAAGPRNGQRRGCTGRRRIVPCAERIHAKHGPRSSTSSSLHQARDLPHRHANSLPFASIATSRQAMHSTPATANTDVVEPAMSAMATRYPETLVTNARQWKRLDRAVRAGRPTILRCGCPPPTTCLDGGLIGLHPVRPHSSKTVSFRREEATQGCPRPCIAGQP
jgi:hypothetical protein